MTTNLLIQADNKQGLEYLLHQHSLKEKVDLIYIDPPFATGNDFTMNGDRASTISSTKNGTIAYSDRFNRQEFLDFLRQRLILLKEILSVQGSIYLHIDYKIGHYVKILMDDIFGIQNFRNDITRIKCNPKNFKRIGFGNIKDMVLFYSKSNKPIWHEPKTTYSQQDIVKLFPKINDQGRRYTTVPIHAPGETKKDSSHQTFKGLQPPKGRHWRNSIETLEEWDKAGLIEWSKTSNPRKIIFADEQEGKRVQDIWQYKDPPYPTYPTEKNSDLLELIIQTSSNKNSIVLDCFCGSGTTLSVAYKNGRQFIGIDKSNQAIQKSKEKLALFTDDLFKQAPCYEYITLP